MSQPKKHVAIRLKTNIREAADIEENEIKATGVFFQKGTMDVLNFKDKIEDLEIPTLVTIQPEKVAIKRSGAVSMHQQFRLGQATENVYKHPHGNIHMETFTNHLSYSTLASGEPAELKLEYTVKLNGTDERKHTLELIFTEEDSR